MSATEYEKAMERLSRAKSAFAIAWMRTSRKAQDAATVELDAAIAGIAAARVREAQEPLALLEQMAREFDFHPVRQGVYVYWETDHFVYRQSPMGNNITRAEAAAALKEAQDD